MQHVWAAVRRYERFGVTPEQNRKRPISELFTVE